MTNLLKLPTFSDDGGVHVVLETPRGSRAKLDYDPKLKTFTLSKSLLAGLTYPYDWGFVPATICEDGDPLDVMVIHEAATFPGLVLTCKSKLDGDVRFSNRPVGVKRFQTIHACGGVDVTRGLVLLYGIGT